MRTHRRWSGKPVCTPCGGKILARSAEEAGGDIAVWSCTPREARATDRYWWIPF